MNNTLEKGETTLNIKMTIWLVTLLLAAGMPTNAQEPMTYARLCGATEGTGDNNDFCALWAQNNWQGMRHALSISIRTARTTDNRNRYYFDHKKGAERGAFIQLKRPWMGNDWHLRHWGDVSTTGGDDGRHTVHIGREGGSGTYIRWAFHTDSLPTTQIGRRYEAGYEQLFVIASCHPSVCPNWFSNDTQTYSEVPTSYGRPSNNMPSDYVRQVVECVTDDFGWRIGIVETRPDCSFIPEHSEPDGE